ncbi:MAG: nitrate ABC transporter permease [Chloroflexota bacterium]
MARSLRGTRLAQRVRYYLPAIVVFFGVLGLWELLVAALDIRAFVLPAPSAIVAALIETWDSGRWPLGPAFVNTFVQAIGGLLVGTIAGLVAAFLTARWTTARDSILPIAVALNAVPIIALAPLFNNWFGLTNPVSKMMVAALLVFFPIMINVTRGLSQVSAASLELMRSYACSDWTILRKVRIPNMLPFFFTALKVATTLSLIGAIVAQYFGGASDVLGRIIVQSASALRFDITWAAIVMASVTGIALYLVVVAIERVVIPWHASLREPEV